MSYQDYSRWATRITPGFPRVTPPPPPLPPRSRSRTALSRRSSRLLVATGVTAASPDVEAQRVCTFEPSAWADFFQKYDQDLHQISEDFMRVKAEKLKNDVKLLFKNSTVVEKLTLVDSLERLGIDRLFPEQIRMAMHEIHKNEFNSCNLFEVALRFRLLREHGLWVSPDVFDKFKGEDGTFNKDITDEPRGLLNLYNAAYLSIHGEPELNEAVSFARHLLESMKGKLKYPLSNQVKRNLQIPLPRTLKRIDALYYISEYREEQSFNQAMLDLAKLDFNLLQCVYQRELKDFCRWGNDLYKEVGLNYSRDRVVELYLWSNLVHYGEHLGPARIILAKISLLVSLLDDTFDMRASLEEGRKLNEAIQRWDECAIPLLPEYLKKYYVRLMNTFREVEDELKQEHKYRVHYCRKALQTLSKNYQQESEWFHSSYVPSFEDHVKCSVISTSAPTICVASLVGIGDEATKEVLDWAMGCTDAVRACGEVGRFMNDMAAFVNAKNKMDVASSVDSYINEYNVSGEVAFAVLDNMVEEAWKTTNRTRFDRHAMLPFVEQITRLTKSMTMMYHGKSDRYTSSRGSKDMIQQLFVDPIAL